MRFKEWKVKQWNFVGVVLASFIAGSLVTAHLGHTQQASANGNRVFELRVYHTLPGRLPALESRFRDTTSKMLARHSLNVVGYWASEADNEFIFMVAHQSREEAGKNWEAMRSDLEFQAVGKSEQAAPTVQKVDSIYLRPADFSPMK